MSTTKLRAVKILPDVDGARQLIVVVDEGLSRRKRPGKCAKGEKVSAAVTKVVAPASP